MFQAGKTSLLYKFLSEFENNTDSSLKDCDRIDIVYFNNFEDIYAEILEFFDDSSTTKTIHNGFQEEILNPDYWNRDVDDKNPERFGIVIFDDILPLISRDNKYTQCLSTLFNIAKHHSNLSIFLLIQVNSQNEIYNQKNDQFYIGHSN
jgi:Cdc6-like AAA superfamily ATPase